MFAATTQIQAIISLQLYYRDSLLTSVPASIITCSSLQCTHSSLPSSVITSLYSKLSSDFSSCLEYNPKFLHQLQDSPSYRPWYHYDLIFCCSPSCLFCFSHTGLLHIPKTWQACTRFLCLLSPPPAVLTPQISTQLKPSSCHFSAQMSSSLWSHSFLHIYIYRIASSIIFQFLLFFFIFLYNTYEGKGNTVYANFLSSSSRMKSPQEQNLWVV